MIGAFRKVDGFLWAELSPRANQLLTTLAREVLYVLDDPQGIPALINAVTGPEESREAPQQDALAVLLPPMSTDPEEAGRIRSLAEDQLRTVRARHVGMFLSTLRAVAAVDSHCVAILEASAWGWMQALNDLRLCLAGELGEQGLPSEPVAEVLTGHEIGHVYRSAPLGDPQEMDAGRMYALLGWWQDSLLCAVHAKVVSG